MASPHPRRRPQKGSPSPSTALTPSRLGVMPLTKSETFHVPLALSTDLVDNSRFMPKRSPTCPKALEQLIDESSQGRVRDILDDFDRTFYRRPQTGALSRSAVPAFDHATLPVFGLHDIVADQDDMDVDDKKDPIEHNSHDSDSGIGSSVSSADDSLQSHTRTSPSSISTLGSSITGNFTSSPLKSVPSGCPLSSPAQQHIDRLILKPIKAEAGLQEFHPLIDDIPRRIGSGEISNLRDLEKVLILLAPTIAVSSKNYLRFCEQSIRVLISTVEYLPPRDLQLPSDRPYSNGYFLDLVAQVRNYAQIMATTRAREAAGQPLAEDDYHPSEKLSLRGGLSEDGTTIELVRTRKGGEPIPIAAESQLHPVQSKPASFKRPVYEDSDDESVHRSMARRKKNEPPSDVIHHCPSCDKEFKRPCDLTKHEKTHSRPFKCRVRSCKYHEYGWPTEKECERHYNDKHAANPHQYRCTFSGCTYTSKRESNCKQHMEKAHNVPYIRSKSNGKKRASDATASTGSASLASVTPQTPLTPFITPNSNQAFPHLATPGASPFLSDMDYFRRGSVATNASHNSSAQVGHNYNAYEYQNEVAGSHSSFDDAITPDTPNLDYSNIDFSLGDMQSSYRMGPDAFNGGRSVSNEGHVHPSYQSAHTSINPPTPAYSGQFHLSPCSPTTNTIGGASPFVTYANQAPAGSQVFDDGVYGFPQLPVPDPSLPQNTTLGTHISPVGQGDLTLFSPDDIMDEGLGDEFDPNGGQDFQLFDEPGLGTFPNMTNSSGNATGPAPANTGFAAADYDYMSGMGFSQQNGTDDIFAGLSHDGRHGNTAFDGSDWINEDL